MVLMALMALMALRAGSPTRGPNAAQTKNAERLQAVRRFL